MAYLTPRTRQGKILNVRVFNKAQKLAFLDMCDDTYDTFLPKVKSYTKSYIDYTIHFRYSINLTGWFEMYKSLPKQLKFKILSIDNEK